MNILHISAQKPDSTGSGIYLSSLIKGLAPLVQNQALVAGISSGDNTLEIEKRFNGTVPFFPVLYNTPERPFNVPGMSDNMPYPATRYRDMTSGQAEAMADGIREAVSRAVDSFDTPPIVVCHHLYYATSLVRDALPGCKVLGISHGTCLRQLKNNLFQKDYILNTIPRLDGIFSLHESQREQISQIFKIAPEMVTVLGSGYNSDIFYRKRMQHGEKKHIVYAGKLSFSKGLVPFLRSLSHLSFSRDSLRITLCGSGSNRDEVSEIKKIAASCRYPVRFAGLVSPVKLAEILNGSDLFVLPSFYEGLPLVILEALACQTPVVTTEIPGLTKWLGEEITDGPYFTAVSLPRMKSVSIPSEADLPAFELRLAAAMDNALRIDTDHVSCPDVSHLSHNAPAKKLYDFMRNLEG